MGANQDHGPSEELLSEAEIAERMADAQARLRQLEKATGMVVWACAELPPQELLRA